MIILYPNLCSLPDVVETKKDQNWKILSRKNCFTAEIEAAVILRPPFRDKLQRKQTSKHCQWNNKPKNYVFTMVPKSLEQLHQILAKLLLVLTNLTYYCK